MDLELFPKFNKGTLVTVKYHAPDNSMSALDVGTAMVGMSRCLKESANIALLDFDDVYILPIEKGSLKSKFIFVKKQSDKYKIKEIIVGIGFTITILNESIQLIDKFGANRVRNPDKEVINAASDPKVLELCQNNAFREGLKKVAQPLNEANNSVRIIHKNDSVEITCEQKYQFYESDDQPILPKLINGKYVELIGEISRLNKDSNDLGFKYEGRRLSIVPIDIESDIAEYHRFLKSDKVKIKGIVVRNSIYETPKIKTDNISDHTQEELDYTKTD